MKTAFALKLIRTLFWCAYLPAGLWACQQVGISWDEGIELHTYKVNVDAILGILQADLTPYQALLTYGDRYYGVGFHIPANAISAFLQIFFPTSNLMGAEAYRITLNHIAIFLCFAASGFLVGQILKRLTQDKWIATLGMFAYLLWPYLLGHGLMNIKDIPFLFAWLLCTNQLLKIVSGTDLKSPLKAYALLGIFTGWLISIRISGVLIAFEYFIFLTLFWNTFTKDAFKKHFAIFALSACLMLFACYPILWHNPLEIFNAIAYMSHHPWDGETLTAGRFIAGTHLHWYIAAWLAVKLPVITLLGLIVSPYALYKLLHTRTNQSISAKSPQAEFDSRALLALILSMLLILATLVIKNIALYNELRQILFIFPILWIVSIASLRFINRRITITLLLVSIAIFAWDNLKLYPYQYVYFNEISRQLPVAKKFEKDYFGLSAHHGAKWLNQSNITPTTDCLYGSPLHLWQYAIDPKKLYCVKDFAVRPKDLEGRPYFIGVPVRDKVNELPIPNCKLIHPEERALALSSQRLVLGEIYECQ